MPRYCVRFHCVAMAFCALGIASAQGLTEKEKEFVEKTAKGGMEEVQIAKMALEKASDPKVKVLAQRLVDDHAKVNAQLTDFAKQKNITLPGEEPGVVEKMSLSKKSGKGFDKAFLDVMEDKHEKSIRNFEKQVKSGSDADLKKWAESTLPTLQGHLLQIEGLE